LEWLFNKEKARRVPLTRQAGRNSSASRKERELKKAKENSPEKQEVATEFTANK
jgi:hypothetical protein